MALDVVSVFLKAAGYHRGQVTLIASNTLHHIQAVSSSFSSFLATRPDLKVFLNKLFVQNMHLSLHCKQQTISQASWLLIEGIVMEKHISAWTILSN